MDEGTLRVGSVADVVVFDAGAEWNLCCEDSRSKSKNTPFDGARDAGASEGYGVRWADRVPVRLALRADRIEFNA